VAAEALTYRPDACPDPETLAAYLEGGLAQNERERVTEHVSDCEACYFVVTEIAQTAATTPVNVEPVGPSPVPHWWKAKPVVWSSSIASALATAAMVWVAVSGGWHSSSSDSAALKQSLALQAALVAAVGNERIVEPRLTGGFAYGTLRGPVRSGESFVAHVSPDVRIAAARIEKEELGRKTPQALRMLGLAYLVTGDVVRAVRVLEEAVNQPDPDPKVLNDLAAAYLVRAARGNQPQDLAKALAAADRAVKADPRLLEAWFNRASALDRMSLGTEARDAWEEYLRLDGQSAWADEARSHLQRLR
jgi:tetratricopeptide (TPR) repeat protein